jgi:hypothetical protein
VSVQFVAACGRRQRIELTPISSISPINLATLVISRWDDFPAGPRNQGRQHLEGDIGIQKMH